MATSRWNLVARHFCSSAARGGKLVQAPLQVYGVEGRYASALYSAATKQSKLETVEKELSSLQSELQKNQQLLEFLSDPSQKKFQKKAAVESLMKKKNFSDLTVNLFVALAENGRMKKTMQVISSFNKLMSAHRGEVSCTVKTAKPLDEATLKELKTALQGFLKKGESLQLQTSVDPTLIGGMTVALGDKFVDMSMRTKIKTYTDLIKAAV
ncbi:ATP synthase subunit O mitochondrial [Biomphalaria glabrata]|uniref:Oligomycin sensitivity conferral protein n=1 Tax=Biomphalaria glabrata TaxID=6526 RepID=A0A2C9LHU9_BIOGL|nr:ATP synthase subunit O; mitochondrial-like [Biomphalaria glabrata]KAI8792374.1 ATP synthase subunit O, mitochondrial [Biomphalaria glabrata]